MILLRMPELNAADPAAELANDRRDKIGLALNRMRQADAVNRDKLRVLQVAVTVTWEVAKSMEDQKFGDTIDDDEDVVAAKKAAEESRKRKDKEKEKERSKDQPFRYIFSLTILLKTPK
jgi:hypothetical protein